LRAEFSTSHVVCIGVRDCTRLLMDTAVENGRSVLDRWLTQYRCESHLIWLKAAWSKACATLSVIDGGLARICPLRVKHTMMPPSAFRTQRLGFGPKPNLERRPIISLLRLSALARESSSR
jgi:hypothetical protein